MTGEWLAALIAPALIAWAVIAILLRTPGSVRLAEHSCIPPARSP